MASLDARSGSNDRVLTASGTVFASVRTATTANEAVASSGDDSAATAFFTPTYYVGRPAMEFDLATAGMAAGAIALSGTIKLTVVGVTADVDNYSVNIFFCTRGSAAGGAFVANDFDEVAGTAACDTPKDLTGLSGVQTFTLNAAALAAISSASGGYVQFSVRLSGDYANSAPTGNNLLDAYSGYDGTAGNRPRLEVTYEPAPTGGVYHLSV